jgi:predicted N-formylglutamate amidohydrolase
MTQRSAGTDPAYDAPFHFTPGERRDVLVLCDHASRALPPEFGDLGLGPELRRDHIAWDPGAARVAQALAAALRCPAFHGGSSRLVVDLNRHPDSAHLVLPESGGHPIPGNLRVDQDQRQRRIHLYFQPYHDAIAAYLDRLDAEGTRPTLLSVHSFTPDMLGMLRPWPIGLMWKEHREWVPKLLSWFSQRGIEIGDNLPYDGHDALGFTLEYHGLQRGLPHVLFEIRQDELLLGEQQERWGLDLAQALIETGAIGPPTSA